ncbi:dTDP-4-dehydrorhamnose reductase [Roseospira marina]|uniref:dTDP-4-dehydrorhamnose reductase n=1 Tax=Roseospira marina TaxID=140057 RepID=A0A5M6IBB0_9PROT|nr:dTDP-4-dehydrorhamnose reductase [Roseospira marina]KAA5605009.1 dTDP-4-dehydrorhamnose reductase [Roseospira marina]MBB4314982.1 dTDP-4-dehydrorhamnose reductase [Roseospira marina]MBB5087982.1 dTDP-4-dehydrorhamnose reductase [Roseospira marina]
MTGEETARVLVTGATGQVGTELARAAWPAGLTPVMAGRETLDLSAPEAAATVVRDGAFSLVVNPAAYTAVDAAETDEALAERVNGEGPRALAMACATAGIPLIQISTDYVFDGTKAGPYVEDDPVAPLGAYGRSKLAGEVAVRAECPRHVILRTAWVFSAHGKNFVKTMLRLAAEKPELRVVADQHGCPTAAHDIARVVVEIARQIVLDGRDDAWGTYHMAGAGATTWHGFAEAIVAAQAARTGKRPPVHPITTAEFPTPAQRPANSVLDCGKLTRTFGLTPRPWPDTLADVLAELAG